VSNGHSYALKRAESKLSEEAFITEKITGIEYLYFLREVEKLCERDIDSVIAKLTQVYTNTLSRECIISYTYEVESKERGKLLDKFLAQLPEKRERMKDGKKNNMGIKLEKEIKNEAFIIPSQVNYVATVYDIKGLDIPNDGSFPIVASVLDSTILWKQVRMKGGAYGVFAAPNIDEGYIGFASYRDPNVDHTLDAFSKIGDSLEKYRADSDEMLKVLTGVIGAQDYFIKPCNLGDISLSWYLSNRSDRERQKMRDVLLSTDNSIFRRIGTELKKGSSTSIVVGNKEKILASKNLDPLKTSVVQLL
jgi:hypothetical protein